MSFPFLRETLALMPDLDATLHVKMARPKKKRRLLLRIIAAIKEKSPRPTSTVSNGEIPTSSGLCASFAIDMSCLM
jgi:hypothetical protein